MTSPLLHLGLIGIVHENAKRDYWATMQRVAELGYEGIEGNEALLKGDVDANLRRMQELGLTPLTVSASREALRDQLDQVVEKALALRVKRVSCWWGPTDSRQQLLRDAELYNQAGAVLAGQGVTLAYHHHDHEFLTAFDGVRAFDLLAAHTDPKAVSFIVDIAWAIVGGQDPAALIRRLGPRVVSLHVKDVSSTARNAEGKIDFTAVGTGVVPICAALLAAGEVGVTWAVVEQDRLCRLDAWETVALSALYLKELGLVAGAGSRREQPAVAAV
ncbi:MAG: sugar phosphate isomerase/epimerase [Phycisphaeraceae bacterium]